MQLRVSANNLAISSRSGWQLQGAQKSAIPTIHNNRDISQELRITWAARHGNNMNDDDPQQRLIKFVAQTTLDQLQRLQNSVHVVVEGSFKCFPPGFSQLYTALGMYACLSNFLLMFLTTTCSLRSRIGSDGKVRSNACVQHGLDLSTRRDCLPKSFSTPSRCDHGHHLRRLRSIWNSNVPLRLQDGCCQCLSRCFPDSVVLGCILHFTQSSMKAKDVIVLRKACNATEPDSHTPSKAVWCATTTVLVTRSSCARHDGCRHRRRTYTSPTTQELNYFQLSMYVHKQTARPHVSELGRARLLKYNQLWMKQMVTWCFFTLWEQKFALLCFEMKTEFDEILIHVMEVQRHPNFYDIKSKSHEDTVMRYSSWVDIASKFEGNSTIHYPWTTSINIVLLSKYATNM